MSNYPDFSSHGYEIKRQLGQNRLGGRFTYLAINTKTQESVVIKQFQFAQPGASWGEYDAYESEIKLLKQLKSPSIPRYLDSFETPTGFCLVQHYIKASSLAQPRHFTPLEIKQIAIAILEILVYLQQQRPTVIHRDIKPENILVDRSQRQIKVYLVDFGFARLGGGDVAASSVVKGTLGFMPPEQLFNRQLTKASDLYSLGATLICLLTKTKSLEIGNLIDKDYRINFKPLMPKLSRSFIDWLSRMTAPSLKERYPNAVTALTALKPIQVVCKDPSDQLLIYVRKISDSFSDAVLNIQQSIDSADISTGPKALAYLREFGVNFYTVATQRLKARKPPLVIGAILIIVGVGIISHWQNRHIRQLLNTNECVGCNLQKANLEGAYLKDANLQGANLNQANLKAAVLENANLESANLSGANLKGTKLNQANLNNAFLENADLKSASLEYAQLRQAFLEGANLKSANLGYTQLLFANLEGANAEGANLSGANLGRANLQHANLKGANLESVVALPDGAILKDANLEGASLRRAYLNKANLTGANLKQANLRGAHLKGANLLNANIEGTELQAYLEGAILPDGTRYQSQLQRTYRRRN